MPDTRHRIRYAKAEALRYLSHLEVARALERACRRAALPVALSEGFNPHLKLVFATNLPVGVSGCAEYLDLTLTSPVRSDDLVRTLNAHLPPGIRALKAAEIPLRGRSLQSLDQRHGFVVSGAVPERLFAGVSELAGAAGIEVDRKKGPAMLEEPGRFLLDRAVLEAGAAVPGCCCESHRLSEGGLGIKLVVMSSGGGLKINDVLRFLGEGSDQPVHLAAIRTGLSVVLDGEEHDPLSFAGA